jgi:hypothetical protein
MSTNLSRLVQSFVTSVVVGKDVVPRVSVVNLGRLIDQMVNPLDNLSSVNGLKGPCAWSTQVPYQTAGKPCRADSMMPDAQRLPDRHAVLCAFTLLLEPLNDQMVKLTDIILSGATYLCIYL